MKVRSSLFTTKKGAIVSRPNSRYTLQLLSAMTLTLALSVPSFAEPGGPGFAPPQRGGFIPPHLGGGPFGPMTPPLLFGRGLQLTEAQEDQIFTILHGAAPATRELHKAARRAREALHELARAETYDAARARELASAEAKVLADIALARAETMHRVRQVLTPEQRATLDQRERSPKRGSR